MKEEYKLSHLKELEAESIHIIREVAAEFENPVMLYSIGKDSSVMVRLAEKAFAPGKVPFPLMSITDADYCCVMTRGHAYDTIVQAQLLATPACYIGVIGSLAKRAGVFHRLVEEYGIDERELDRIITPVGLNIKAETPAEIAISITGQMIQVRAERKAAMK